MRLVWFTVFSPFVIALIGLILAIAIPNFIKAKDRARGIRPRVSVVGPAKTIGDAVKERGALSGDVITVHLKNGNTFEAVISSESEENIEFQIKGGKFILPRSDILKIE